MIRLTSVQNATVRESLAMLPQLVISARLRRFPIRKNVYVFGCVVQSIVIVSFGLMGGVAQMFSGALIGIVAVALIAIFALGRSLCSITHKDLLGKTVDRGRRGSVSDRRSACQPSRRSGRRRRLGPRRRCAVGEA